MLFRDPRVGYGCHQKLAGRVSFSLNFTDQERVLRAIEVAFCGYKKCRGPYPLIQNHNGMAGILKIL